MPQCQEPPRNQLAWQARLMDGKLALVSDIMVINLSGDQQLTFVFFLPTTGHGMVADGSVGSDSALLAFLLLD